MPKNFALGAVVLGDRMLRTGEEFTGLRLVPEGVQGGGQFAVWAGQTAITRNCLEVLSESELQLSTQLLPGATSVAKPDRGRGTVCRDCPGARGRYGLPWL